ncbi:hypothetical protein [Methanoculleus sp.]|uniref:hypothetical protein n=1 Tax=Methanoculleus sp. TaxID=90427 RepID=UPI00263289D3|nr:hypothetical protein [Methanoculleus sp.]
MQEDPAARDVCHSRGLVYNVNADIQYDGDVTVTTKLIDEEKGFTRDQVSVLVFIPAGETRRISLMLDGDVGRTYRHSVEVS